MHLRSVGFALACLLSAACTTRGSINSIDDLTAQVDVEGLLNLPQQRLLSLSGMLPEGGVGSMVQYNQGRSPFTATALSQFRRGADGAPVAVQDDEQAESYVLSRTLEFDVPPGYDKSPGEYLIELRNDLFEVRRKALEAIRARVAHSAYAARAVTAEEAEEARKLLLAAQSLEGGFYNAWDRAVAKIRTPGLLVVRATTQKSLGLAAKVGSFLGLNDARSEEHATFTILADLEWSQLYLARDLDAWADPPARDWSLVGKDFPYFLNCSWFFLGRFSHFDTRIVTASLAAEHVLFTSDLAAERRFQAELRTTVEELLDLGGTLRAVDEVAIEAVLEAVESLGNVGIVGAAEHELHWLPRVPVPGEPQRQTVYQVLSDYDDLARMVQSGPRLHLIHRL